MSRIGEDLYMTKAGELLGLMDESKIDEFIRLPIPHIPKIFWNQRRVGKQHSKFAHRTAHRAAKIAGNDKYRQTYDELRNSGMPHRERAANAHHIATQEYWNKYHQTYPGAHALARG